MNDFLRNIQNSPYSILLGLLAGILLALILYLSFKFLPKVFKPLRRKLNRTKDTFSVGTEVRLRNDIFHYAQKQHLASSLFSLDEIIVEPKVMLPIIQTPKSIELAPTDSVSLSIPYMPDWPEFAAIYKAPTLKLIEGLQGNSNIILAGHPGSGKTVALAWLASSLARNAKGLGNLANLFPVYVHATDIPTLYEQINTKSEQVDSELPGDSELLSINPVTKINNANDVIDLLIQAISRYVSPINLARLPRVIKSTIENQQAVLIVDRVDELPPARARMVTDYLRFLIEGYPKLKIVVAMSYDDLAMLPALEFSLLAIASWTDEDRINLLHRWSQHWAKWIIPAQKSHSKRVKLNYLRSWLVVDNKILKPLEYTLKVWAAFAGDILANDGPSAIESYIRRMTCEIKDPLPGLEGFALRLLNEIEIMANPSGTGKISIQHDADTSSINNSEYDEESSPSQVNRIKTISLKEIHDIDILTSNGFLRSYPGSRYGFSHPTIFGYLAGKALSDIGIPPQLQKQPSWTGRNLSLYFFAKFGDVTNLIQSYLQEDDVFHTNHLLISRWMQVAPKNRAWRTVILRTLTSILQKERETISLVAKIIAAMSFSGDVGVSIYFRQLLKSENANLIQLATLGLGILADKKAIEELNQLLQGQSPSFIRSACLALAAMGEKQSLEILASSLLKGDEELRRYAAEALANNPQEGQPALREGSSMEDLLVRRSVVFGLIRVNQPWATKIVENLQLDDNEWVVRNAAIQAFDELQRRISYAPAQLPDLIETQWLIDYADRHGTTVAPGKPALQLVCKALSDGSPDEKLYAMDYLRMLCDPNTRDIIYSAYSSSKGDIRDIAYYTLWLMTLAGIRPPISFE